MATPNNQDPPFTIQEFVNARLDKEYKRTATPMLAGIQAVTVAPESAVQIALTELDEEVARLTEKDKAIQSTNKPLKNALKAFGSALLVSQRLISRNSPAIEATGIQTSIPSVTAKVFLNISTNITAAGGDPISPMAMGRYASLAKQGNIKWTVPKTMDFATAFTSTPEWIARMETWGSGYSKFVTESILKGIERGDSPRVTANTVRELFQNIPYYAAENLTRTLQLTSYRESSVAMELLNGSFIRGKIRIAKLDERTCLSCIALHGTPLAVGERVDDHYRGRCSEFYQVIGGADFPEDMQADSRPGKRNFVPWQTGTDWFNSLPPQRQARQTSFRTSPAKFKAFQNGTDLSQFVGDHTDDVFGQQKIELSLAKAIGKSEAEKLYAINQPKSE